MSLIHAIIRVTFSLELNLLLLSHILEPFVVSIVHLDKDGPQRRNVVVVKLQLLLHHFQDAVLEWRAAELILDQDQVVLRALYIQYECLLGFLPEGIR